MIQMSSLRKRFNVVISDLSLCNSIDNREQLCSLLNELSVSGIVFYAIVHDKDSKSTGELKRKHLHIVISFNERKRAKQLLNLLCELFLTNTENIQISDCISYAGSVQYLTHKNDESKYQYQYSEIITNDDDMLKRLYNQRIECLQVDENLLFELIDNRYSIRQIIETIGLPNYMAYRNVIRDLIIDRS